METQVDQPLSQPEHRGMFNPTSEEMYRKLDEFPWETHEPNVMLTDHHIRR